MGHIGSYSDRNGDKWQAAGLTPEDVDGVAAPAEAEAVLVCRKLLAAELSAETFLEPGMKERWYSGGDEGNYHTMYIAEIEKVFVKE